MFYLLLLWLLIGAASAYTVWSQIARRFGSRFELVDAFFFTILTLCGPCSVCAAIASKIGD